MPAVRVLPARRVVFALHAQYRLQSTKTGVQAFGEKQHSPMQNCVRAGGLTRKIRCLFWCLFGVYEVMRSIPTVSTIQNRDKR